MQLGIGSRRLRYSNGQMNEQGEEFLGLAPMTAVTLTHLCGVLRGYASHYLSDLEGPQSSLVLPTIESVVDQLLDHKQAPHVRLI